jgi:Xaa-Pro aminopeptidase
MFEHITPPEINLVRMRRYRLDRIRDQLRQRQISACVIVSPTNLRYAVDFREYALFQSHIPMFYLILSADGPVIMYGAAHQTCDLVDDYRPTAGFNPFDSGFDLASSARNFARQVKAYLNEAGIHEAHPLVAVERMPTDVFYALQTEGIHLADGESLIEQARTIKSNEEIQCMQHAIAVAELGIDKMKQAMQPGVTENQLWSLLHQVNIANNGDWMEGRMLASGPRTNPWLQEASDRVMQRGDLVAFDTDMVGPFGYCADISRTWLCGDGTPSAAQQALHDHASEEVDYNMSLLSPGIRFSEIQHKIYPRHSQFIAHRYPCFMHGVGMSDEYPKLYYPEDNHRSYEGVIKENMVICVESFTGSDQGGEGVKLEHMVRITETGTELLSTYPTAL